MKKKLTAALLCICLLLTLAGCGSGRKKGTLRVGVRTGVVNFGYYNSQTEQYYGLDIDIANALVEEMGYNLELVTTHAETRESDLNDGVVDMVVALYTITDARKEIVDFSQPYYTDYSHLVVESSSQYRGLGDLKGKRIAIHGGTNASSQQEIIDRMIEQGVFRTEQEAWNSLTFVPIEKYNAMSYALEVGEVDAFVMDGCIASNYLNEDRVLLDGELKEIHYGVATAKGNPLMAEIETALQKLIDDGTVEQLTEKWQGGDRHGQTIEN